MKGAAEFAGDTALEHRSWRRQVANFIMRIMNADPTFDRTRRDATAARPRSVDARPSRGFVPTAFDMGRRGFLAGGFVLVVLIGVKFLLRDSLKYADWTEVAYQRFWPQRIWLAIHVVSASCALLVAPLQFVGIVRKRFPAVHRWTGWVYVVGALIAGIASFRLSFLSSCRMCIPPFAIWSGLFLLVTGLAIVMAVRRNFEAHRQFMIRSWVLMNGFVLVRLDTHIPFPFPTGPGVDRPAMLIWAVWVIPLIITEMWLTWTPVLMRNRRQLHRVGVS